MTFEAISDEEAALVLAEVDPEGGELDWWGWNYMVARLEEKGYRLVIVREHECGNADT